MPSQEDGREAGNFSLESYSQILEETRIENLVKTGKTCKNRPQRVHYCFASKQTKNSLYSQPFNSYLQNNSGLLRPVPIISISAARIATGHKGSF